VRRWELVADGSAKFWEIGRDGAEVTVRFGRLGTAGRTQTKELASAGAAQSHVEKLVAEKEKKGYRSVEPAGAEQPAAPEAAESVVVDEDVWVMPAAWLRNVVRQRGFDPAPEFSVDTAKAAEARRRIVEQADVIERVLSVQSSKAELVSAAREHLAGTPNPVGAAALAAITSCELPSVHAWTADHGVAFAAAAAVEYTGLTFSQEWHERRGTFINIRLQPRRGGFHTSLNEPEGRMLTAVRYALAVADDAAREAAEAALDGANKTLAVKEVRSYLVPSRADWFAEVCNKHHRPNHWWMVPCSARSRQDYEDVKQSLSTWTPVLHTALYVLGPAIAPLLAEELDDEYLAADSRKQALKVLAALPTDEAFTILLDRLDTKYVRPAVLSAMAAFPARAARLLAERASTSEDVRQLLSAHLRSNPSIEMPAEVAELLATSDVAVVPAATPDQLPPLLVSPPWLHRRPQPKPLVLKGIPVPDASVHWEEGEREKWLACGGHWYDADQDWRKLLADYRTGKPGYYYDNELFLFAPEDEVRHLLADWQPNFNYGVEDWGKRLAARFGIDALPPLLRLAKSNSTAGGVVLLPFATVEVATVMAGWFAKTKQPRRWAQSWLARHRERAARLLLPAAVGKPGTARRSAEAAIRHLHDIGVDVAAVAASCGAEAAISAVLALDPVDVLPAKLPVLGDWADIRLLPQVLLSDRKHALSPEAGSHLLMTAALSKPGEIYAGLPIAREALDPHSLAQFAWAVFEQWHQAGGPSKESWALDALGWFGDDSTVRALSPLIRTWPGESQHARAVAGLDVLAEIGTEVALSHLNSIAEKVKFKGLKTRAEEKVSQIAAELGLSRDQLADRLVPHLGLDDEASLVIDYGPRQFRVGFDEHLKPYVLDADGKRRKDLPKPGARDDQDRAPLEHKRFTALKKDVRTIAADQIHRLERAMVNQRTWTAEEFYTVLAAHPLLWHIVRRLVWITDEGVSFRLAEDRTLADSRDDEFTLPDTATVRVAHPVDLQTAVEAGNDASSGSGGAAAAWGEIFADYEILQPFPQLGRPFHLLTAGEDLLPRLKKYSDVPYPVGKILGLTKKGWIRGEPQDAGVECWITRPFPAGGALVASLDPGIAVGAVDEFPEVSLTDLWFAPDGEGEWSAPKDAPATFDVDPITVSELLSELESLHS
jgi:predicted DNA-binding WGR domain protein